MAKTTKPLPEDPTLGQRIKLFFKTYVPLSSIPFYASLLFSGMLLALLVLPPYSKTKVVIFALLLSQSVLLTRYRYFDWRPEKSKQFAIGATMVVNVVHTEGILRYKRDGMEYALFSNKVGEAKDAPPAQK